MEYHIDWLTQEATNAPTWSYMAGMLGTCVGISAHCVGLHGQRHDVIVAGAADGCIDVELIDDKLRSVPPACTGSSSRLLSRNDATVSI